MPKAPFSTSVLTIAAIAFLSGASLHIAKKAAKRGAYGPATYKGRGRTCVYAVANVAAALKMPLSTEDVITAELKAQRGRGPSGRSWTSIRSERDQQWLASCRAAGIRDPERLVPPLHSKSRPSPKPKKQTPTEENCDDI